MDQVRFTKAGVDLNSCFYCHEPIDEFSRTIDHLYPKSRGGKLSNSNKVPCCYACNQLKGNMTVKEFHKAIKMMIRFEKSNHKKKLSYLFKIERNTGLTIEKNQG